MSGRRQIGYIPDSRPIALPFLTSAYAVIRIATSAFVIVPFPPKQPLVIVEDVVAALQVIGGPTVAGGYTWWNLSGSVGGFSYSVGLSKTI